MHHARTPPQPPSERLKRPVSADLEAVLLKGLAKNPTIGLPRPANSPMRWPRARSPRSWTAAGGRLVAGEQRGGIAIETGPATKAVRHEATVRSRDRRSP